MLEIYNYQRLRAVMYAEKWAFSRNPLFRNFTGIGGDCTNFISQCVLAGSCAMNFLDTFGWYYISSRNRTPSWTGVEFFYNFITGNEGEGPYGREVTRDEVEIGDIVQIARNGDYYHTLLISDIRGDEIYVSAHSDDAYDRRLSSYTNDSERYIKILGVRRQDYAPDCYEGLYNGTVLFL